MLLDESALKERCSKARYSILQRAKPVKWKSGKREGKIKRPGIDKLSFSTEDLWQHALRQVGPGVKQCPYCVEIGRPANLITLANYQWDHKIPVARGGTPTFDNLFAVCEDCNRCKGDLTFEFFVAVMAAVEKWPDARDRKLFFSCLRSHGVSKRLRGFYAPKPDAPPRHPPPATGRLALREDF
jgi:5-methylcytosine-specific restriction endonuclease McrA